MEKRKEIGRQNKRKEREMEIENTTIYRNRLQDIEIDRFINIYREWERERDRKRAERERLKREREREWAEGRKDTDQKVELIEGVGDKGE